MPLAPNRTTVHQRLMGQARQKANARQRLLLRHSRCIYCGAPATTTDHCPPRCVFVGRQWPETYEFAACKPCNDEARLDEQAIGVLVRLKLSETQSAIAKDEWRQLLRGVMNNQYALVREWMSMRANERRHVLREAFGQQGDFMRQAGWGSIRFGDLTHALVQRFMIKLAKALYYRHNGRVFEGVIYTRHISLLVRDSTPEFIQNILSGAPAVSEAMRSNQPLTDQFIYRFSHSPEHGVLYAVVQFSEQFIFQLIVLSWHMADYLAEVARANNMDIWDTPRYEFRIDHGAS